MTNYTSEEKSLPQKISEDIISLILEENLQSGDKLPNESILSKRLDAGRSSIREAMKLLASRNIVTIRQGSGTYVASSPGMVEDPLGFLFIGDKKKLVHDLLEVRFLLEPSIAAMSSKNLVVPRLIPVINSSIPLFVETTGNRLHNETIESHREIAQAIAAHDPLRAQDAMYLHLVYNRKIISASEIS